jgi:hypothetical protein
MVFENQEGLVGKHAVGVAGSGSAGLARGAASGWASSGGAASGGAASGRGFPGRAFSPRGLSRVGLSLVGLSLAGLLGCGSSGGSRGSEAERTPSASNGERDVSGADGYEPQYRIVETDQGMAVEAVSADQVQTISCSARSCPGLCDECALAACQAAGGEAPVCGALAAQCSDSCSCGSFGGDRCGFPACTENPRICYIESGDPAAPAPGDPEPAPAPIDPAPAPDPSPASNPGF